MWLRKRCDEQVSLVCVAAFNLHYLRPLRLHPPCRMDRSKKIALALAILLVITCPTANHVAASLRHAGTKWNSEMCLRQCRSAASDRWTGHFSWVTSDLKLWRHRLQHFTACDCVQCKLALTAYCVGPRYSHHNMAAYCTYSSSRSDIPFAFHILNCALDMFSVDLHITWTYSATSGKKKLDEK